MKIYVGICPSCHKGLDSSEILINKYYSPELETQVITFCCNKCHDIIGIQSQSN